MKSKQEQIDEMKKNIETLQKNLEALEKSGDSVEFLKEGVTISSIGSVQSVEYPTWIGNDRALTFSTEEIAKKVDKITQQSYKIAQYVFQKEPDYVPNWNEEGVCNYFIYYRHLKKCFYFSFDNYYQGSGKVYMSEEVAKQLVEDLNNGNYSID